MKTRRQLAIALVLMVALLAIAPAASAGIDYSKNSATGDYAPLATPAAEATDTATESAFAWGDAAIGAGAALTLVFAVAAVTHRRWYSRAPIARA